MAFSKTTAVIKLLPFLVAGMLFNASSAKQQDSEKEPTKMEQVMASHDEVMDEMPKLAKLMNKLQTKADASYDKTKYKKAIADLKSANKSMMNWMTGFGERFEADEMMKGKALSEQKQKSPQELIDLIRDHHDAEDMLLQELEKVCKDLPKDEFDIEPIEDEGDEQIKDLI